MSWREALIVAGAVGIVWWAIAHRNVNPQVTEGTGAANYTGAQ